MQKTLTDDTTVTVDVGSHYIWMARKFRSYNPRHLLFSNGMQTLGVALPWAIAAALVLLVRDVQAETLCLHYRHILSSYTNMQ